MELASLEVLNADWVVVLAHFVFKASSSSPRASLDTLMIFVNSVILNYYRENIVFWILLESWYEHGETMVIVPSKDRGLQMQPPLRQRTPLQSLSSPNLNITPRSTIDTPILNELHPIATAMLVRIETMHDVVTPNHGAQASIVGHVDDDENDDVIASPTPSTNLCEDCCARPREYGLQGECSPRFCHVCVELHRHANRLDVV